MQVPYGKRPPARVLAFQRADHERPHPENG